MPDFPNSLTDRQENGEYWSELRALNETREDRFSEIPSRAQELADHEARQARRTAEHAAIEAKRKARRELWEAMQADKSKSQLPDSGW